MPRQATKQQRPPEHVHEGTGEILTAKSGVRHASSWRKGEPPKEIPQVERGSRGQKVDAIADAMRRLEWRASHIPHYAEAWGVAGECVREASAEAHRVLAREVRDPDRATGTVVTYLQAALERAWELGDMRAIGDLSRTWASIVGAVAPTKVQVAAVVSDLQKLPVEELRRQAQQVADAVAKRLALGAGVAEGLPELSAGAVGPSGSRDPHGGEG